MFSSKVILPICFLLAVASCTPGGREESKPFLSMPGFISDIVSPEPTGKIAAEELRKIKEASNKSEVYKLTEADVQFLISEGIVESDSELKGWVE